MLKKTLALVGLPILSSLSIAELPSGWEITRLGLMGSSYTRSSDDYQHSGANFLNEQGQVTGYSDLYNATANIGRAAWFYNGISTTRLGLIGGINTSSSGYQYSDISYLNEQGQVSGYSDRFTGENSNGRAAWLYDSNATIQLGLTGNGYIRSSDGYEYSGIKAMNAQGQVLGFSQRYIGLNARGIDVWLFDGSQTVKLGFSGDGFTRGDGYQYSRADFLNRNGQVAGLSQRLIGNSNKGQVTWLHDASNTIQIGLTGDAHTRSDGYQFSRVDFLNEQGQVLGASASYNGTNRGISTWLYDGSTTVRIGLTSSAYTNSNGSQTSEAQILNEQGQVTGYSHLFNGTSISGVHAWLYDGNSTVQIGFYGTSYTRNDGFQHSEAQFLNEHGQVVGISDRYDSSGQSTWIYGDGTTVQIGLTGSGYTHSNGHQYSEAQFLNEQGQAVGNSKSFNNSIYRGRASWIYSGGSTVQIGLTGTGYMRSNDGYEHSEAQFLNNQGIVAGTSERYKDDVYTGQSAWLYDDDLNQTFDLTLSERSDGYASSSVQYLGEDGLVLGYYTVFDDNDLNLGDSLFYFTVEDGLFDLKELLLLTGLDISLEGWDYLADTIRRNSFGQFIGTGILSDGSNSQGVYLLTSSVSQVPVPATAWLFGSALIGLVGIRQKK